MKKFTSLLIFLLGSTSLFSQSVTVIKADGSAIVNGATHVVTTYSMEDGFGMMDSGLKVKSLSSSDQKITVTVEPLSTDKIILFCMGMDCYPVQKNTVTKEITIKGNTELDSRIEFEIEEGVFDQANAKFTVYPTSKPNEAISTIIQFKYTNTTGILSNDAKYKINVVESSLNYTFVSGGKKMIRICNMAGHTVWSTTVNATEGSIALDLPKGIYLYTVIGDEMNETKKFMIK